MYIDQVILISGSLFEDLTYVPRIQYFDDSRMHFGAVGL